jgi:putative phosphoribosyl transferase
VLQWIGITKLFRDRHHAGKQLATLLFQYTDEDPIILALPRGGVPIGFEVAKLLHAPLDVIVVRKIGLPRHPEFGVGAIAEGNVQLFDDKTLEVLGLSPKDLQEVIDDETEELKRRVKVYRGSTALPDLQGRTVILVDDGLATGITARAAITAVRKLRPKKIIFASPVCAHDSVQEMHGSVTDVICLTTPLDFTAVGLWYQYFDQTTDEEVQELLQKSKHFKLEGKPHTGKAKKGRRVKGKHHAEPEAYMH